MCFYVSAASAQIGLITNIGTTVNNMDAIAFNSSGVLYGATSGTGSLYTIDPATGAATLVHALVGVSNASLTYGLKGLAFQPGAGTLYGATSPDSPNSGDNLVTINPATGQVTVIGPSGTGYPYASIAFAPNGTLYGWLVASGFTVSAAPSI
jgi:sugar lactone lactonase YvrE